MSEQEKQENLLETKIIKQNYLKSYIEFGSYLICLAIGTCYQFYYNSLEVQLKRIFNLTEQQTFYFTLFFIAGMGLCVTLLISQKIQISFKKMAIASMICSIILDSCLLIQSNYQLILLGQIFKGFFSALLQLNQLEFAIQKFKYHSKKALFITILNIAPSIGSLIGMTVPGMIIDDQASLNKITVISLIMLLFLMILIFSIKYQPREMPEPIYLKDFIKNKQFISLIRISSFQFCLCILISINVERIILNFNFDIETKSMIYLFFSLGSGISATIYSLKLQNVDQDILVRQYSKSLYVITIILGGCLYYKLKYFLYVFIFLYGAQLCPIMTLCNLVLSGWRHKFDLTKSLTVLFLFQQLTTFFLILLLETVLSYLVNDIISVIIQISIVTTLLLISSYKANFYQSNQQQIKLIIFKFLNGNSVAFIKLNFVAIIILTFWYFLTALINPFLIFFAIKFVRVFLFLSIAN